MQKGLTSALLVQWTKGFNCSGVQGRDVVQLLREAVKRVGVRIATYNFIRKILQQIIL